ncbi:beta-methylgalactoside transporter inner membrane component [bacterium BMS3Abin02]|nr:beta-methylgalactoside transporter inner membrane component [bacterium BMS3Abin02]GBE21196.1 beta-methylgalactoside transporter inner membrane component [bacterium BMS3Bbin01]HDH26296.1 ABC transporter permease [Actinomycetota bacterium]
MSEFFTASVLVSTIGAGIRLSTSYLYAAIGETFGQRSGVLNLGVDGIMLLGAFGAYYTVLKSGDLWLGLAIAAGIGLLMGLAMAFASVTLQAEQGISGIGFYLFGLGMSALLFQKLVGTPLPIQGFPDIHLPVLSDIPVIGEPLFSHSVIVYGAFLLVPVGAFILNKTTLGLKIRSVGENPEAADTLGVSVAKIRYTTIMFGSMLAGIGGAALAIELGIFQQNLTAGQGFIAIALVYFGAWRPLGVMLGALLYGFVAAIVLQLNTLGVIPRSASDLAAMLPALITILALVVAVQKERQPAALAKPYQRGE